MTDALRPASAARRLRFGPRLVTAIVVVIMLAAGLVLLPTLVAPRLAADIGRSPARMAPTAEMASIALQVRAWLADHGRSRPDPDFALDRLTAGAHPLLRSEDLRDPWGRPYAIVVHDDGAFDVVSHGADGRPGGVGADADIVHAVRPGP